MNRKPAMKRIITTLTAVLLACGALYGQDEPGPSFEHLKPYTPMIGTWLYEGPLLEDVPDYAEKGTKCVFQFSWRRILKKSVVEENWSLEFEGGKKLVGKALIGWHAAEKEIVYGGMNSIGTLTLGTVTFDEKAKTSTLTEKGVKSDGEEMSFKGMVTKTGKDTLTWQALERVGGIVEGGSPVYSFKRVKRTRRSKQAK
jgi:hypothetical protein